MQTATPLARPLLIELLTEELPPRALHRLAQAFAEGLRSVLDDHHLLTSDCTVTEFATPRRLAAHFSAVLQQAPDRDFMERLMPAHIGLTADGEISPALARRLASKGLEHIRAEDLIVESDGRQDFVFARGTTAGANLSDGLQAALDHSIGHLPIPKVMRYQRDNGESVRFVRPAHRLVALWGDQTIAVTALGLHADRITQGHRFMGQQDIHLENADRYESQLLEQGRVIASFSQRRALIAAQLEEQARTLDSTVGDDAEVDALLDEVTALVEYPRVYAGTFDEGFLRVPSECLILTMRLNQKYFPLFTPDSGSLTNRFLIVSNMELDDPSTIVEGNERVVRPRLADAQFFFDTDLRTPLEDRVQRLRTSVYHNRLGSQFERMERVRAVAVWLAARLGADEAQAARAALLAKADLNSSMVAEFPELQGIMGAYYARHDGEPEEIVAAIRNQYALRISQPVAAETLIAAIVFIADRVETLVGIWGIGQAPTGERDPFGLRRAALGILSAWENLTAGGYLTIARSDELDLHQLLDTASRQFPDDILAADTIDQVSTYILERYRNQLNQHYDRHAIDAVLALNPPLHQVRARIDACTQFASKPEAASLAAANKRVTNILRRADSPTADIDAQLLAHPAEQALAEQIRLLEPQAGQRLAAGDFSGNMAILAQSRDAVDAFFDDVMIMAEDPALRANRLALLGKLHALMNQVADISRLAS